MKKIFLCLLIVCCQCAFAGCTQECTEPPNSDIEYVTPVHSEISAPTIEYIAYGCQQCPVLKTTSEDESIRIINQEIESHFLLIMNRLYDGEIIQTYITSTDQYLSIVLSAKYSISYGTDGEVWGICYDYLNKIVIPTGAFLSEFDLSYVKIHENVQALLTAQGSYEYFHIPFCYFNSNSEPILTVIAIEHPSGADAWKRIFYYSPVSDSFVDSLLSK